MKWLHLTLIFIMTFIAIGCSSSTEVREEKRYYKVRPNVTDAPPPPPMEPRPAPAPAPAPNPVPPSNDTGYNPPPANDPVYDPAPAPTPAPSEPAGPPNWTGEVARQEGISALDRDRFPRVAQAKAMARRGAILDAKRNLLEYVLGLQMSSQTSVKDMVTEQDQINTQTSGLIRSAKVVDENYDAAEGTYMAVVEMPLNDVWEYASSSSSYNK